MEVLSLLLERRKGILRAVTKRGRGYVFGVSSLSQLDCYVCVECANVRYCPECKMFECRHGRNLPECHCSWFKRIAVNVGVERDFRSAT